MSGLIVPAFRVLTAPLALVLRNDRERVTLGDDYEDQTAQLKQAKLRSRAEQEDHRADGDLPRSTIRLSALHSLRNLHQNLDYASDIRHPSLGAKALHQSGVTANVSLEKLTPEEVAELCDEMALPDSVREAALENAAGGIKPTATGFLAGCVYGMVRLSIAVPYPLKIPGRPPFGFVPGIGLKCFVDGKPSRNLLFMDTMEGQGDDLNFFRNTLSSILSPSHRAETAALAALFEGIEQQAFVLPTAGLADIRRDGSAEPHPWIPLQLHLVATTMALESHRVYDDFRADLIAGLGPGDAIYTIFAARTRGELGVPILRMAPQVAPHASHAGSPLGV